MRQPLHAVVMMVSMLVATSASIAFAQSPDVPQQIAAYTGVWEGAWTSRAGDIDHTLIVGQLVREGAPVPSKPAEPIVIESVAAPKEKTASATALTDMKKPEGSSAVQGPAFNEGDVLRSKIR